MLTTYKGSCHCGAVFFEADIDLDVGTHKCNCSICVKTRSWNVIIKPNAFRLLSAEDTLSDYTFGRKSIHHLYCTQCGVRSFARGHIEALGGHYVSIQLASLDNIALEDLMAAPIHYSNGRIDDWNNPPTDILHL